MLCCVLFVFAATSSFTYFARAELGALPERNEITHPGRLSLQLVADFLEHWQLHQTLSILKLETDLAEGDLLPREELASIAGSNDVATAAARHGEAKSSGDKSAPVLHKVCGGGLWWRPCAKCFLGQQAEVLTLRRFCC